MDRDSCVTYALGIDCIIAGVDTWVEEPGIHSIVLGVDNMAHGQGCTGVWIDSMGPGIDIMCSEIDIMGPGFGSLGPAAIARFGKWYQV